MWQRWPTRPAGQDHSMSGEHTDRLPTLDRFLDPAVSYTRGVDGPEVLATNDPFEAVFGSVTEGSPLVELLGSLSALDSPDGQDVCFEAGGRFVVSGDDIETDIAPTRYHGQVIPPEDGDCNGSNAVGYVLFTRAVDNEGLSVDSVASVISHDLRNPLDVAKARLEAGRELDSEEHLEHVEQAHERMERIIEDVLTLARGEEFVDPEQAVELGAVAEEAWQTVETDRATLDVEGELPTAVVDRDRVGRLFENLFRNAVEHGGRDVTVRVGRLEGDERGLYVADDGGGIPTDQQDLIFEPGYSADEHGTGLGLAIVERIADLHGWSVAVRTSDGGGARFEISGLDETND